MSKLRARADELSEIKREEADSVGKETNQSEKGGRRPEGVPPERVLGVIRAVIRLPILGEMHVEPGFNEQHRVLGLAVRDLRKFDRFNSIG